MRHILFLGMAMGWMGCASPNASYFGKAEHNANVFVAPDAAAIRKVAVMPFKAQTELIGSSVSDLMVTEILRLGRYELVERSQMAKVLGETELALSGISASRAAEVGAMLGADGVIIGTVDDYGTVAQRSRVIPVVAITARMIDCRTGKIVWSVDLARRAENRSVTLPQHARAVIHEMVATLWRERGIRK